jgi:hypothetical protein
MKNLLKTHRVLSQVTQDETSAGTGITQARLSRLETRPNSDLVQSITVNEIERLTAFFNAYDGTGEELRDAILNETYQTITNQTRG